MNKNLLAEEKDCALIRVHKPANEAGAGIGG